MELKGTRTGARMTVRLYGELDDHNAARIRSALEALIADPKVKELQLEMSNVTFMDSAGLGVVLGRYRSLAAKGGKLIVSGVSAPVDQIFRMSGVYALVERA